MNAGKVAEGSLFVQATVSANVSFVLTQDKTKYYEMRFH